MSSKRWVNIGEKSKKCCKRHGLKQRILNNLSPQINGTILNRVKQGIIGVLNYVAENGPDTMKKHLYDHFDSSPEEFYEHVEQTSTINEHEETTKLILDGMRSYHQTESDKMIINIAKAKGFAITAVSQFLRLYFTWKELSSAPNVIGDSSELTTIRKKLEKMETMVTQLLDHCENNPNDESFSRRMSKINTLYTSTLTNIGNLRVTIDGRIQCLDALAGTSVVDGVTNVANAATQGYYLWQVWSNLTTFSKAVGVACVAWFTGLAFGNVITFQIERSAG